MTFFTVGHARCSASQQEEVATILRDTLQSIKLSDRGVYVQASTLGSLEALLEFLRTSKIPVSIVIMAVLDSKPRVTFKGGLLDIFFWV